MALAFSVTQHFAPPPARVFAALTDLEGAAAWMPGFVRIERVGGGASFGPGTTWRETRKLFGREATEEFEVTACRSPRHIAVRVDGTKGSSRRGEYLFDYTLAPAPAGTEVTLRGEIRGLGLLGMLVGRLLIGPYRRACAQDLQALARHLEGCRS
jgi:carbon monoxide dehydrogenase subunit G